MSKLRLFYNKMDNILYLLLNAIYEKQVDDSVDILWEFTTDDYFLIKITKCAYKNELTLYSEQLSQN